MSRGPHVWLLGPEGSSFTLIVPAPMRPIRGTSNQYHIDPRGALATEGIVYYQMEREPYYERIDEYTSPVVITKVPGLLGYRIATLFVEDRDELVENDRNEQHAEDKVHSSHEG